MALEPCLEVATLCLEEQLVQNLLQIVNQNNFVEGLEDEILWQYDSSGKFSIKSFSLQVFRNAATSLSVHSQTKIVWKGLAPPRVEL